jgi:ABC-type transport system substrate-binding protein
LGEIGNTGTIGMRLLVDRAPFDDPRLRRAIHLALDRRLLGEQMFPSAPGRVGFLSAGPVGWQMTQWALPRAELDALPGYRSSQAERDEDIAEARLLWQAGDGPSSLDALGANIPTYIPNAGTPEMVRELAENLDLDLDVSTVDYVDLAQCFVRNQQDAAEGTCAYAFGFDNGWIDLDDWLYPFLHSTGAKNSSRLSDPALDTMLDEQRQEFDTERRQQLGLQIQRYLLEEANDGLGVHALVPLINNITRTLYWSYIRNQFQPQTWFGQNFLYADVWLDQNDPNYAGRSA